MVRTLLCLSALAYGGAYLVGVLVPAQVGKVDRPMSQVATALETLDIRKEPGAPGTDPTRSGGILPLFRHERTPEGLVWTVMSGAKVAIRLFADLTPIDHGRGTNVKARVARGDAPDAFVSPAFRSEALTRIIFVTALRNALDDLVLPHATPEECGRWLDLLTGNTFDPEPSKHATLGQAIGAAARSQLQQDALETEMRRHGCRPRFST